MHKTEEMRYISIAAAIAFVLVFILFIAFSTVLYELNQQEKFVRKKCSEFTSYKEAEAAYKNGNTRLDGNHDGIPCNSLY